MYPELKSNMESCKKVWPKKQWADEWEQDREIWKAASASALAAHSRGNSSWLSQKGRSRQSTRTIHRSNPTPVRCWTCKCLKSYHTSLKLLKKLGHALLSSCSLLERLFLAYRNSILVHQYAMFPCNALQHAPERTHSEIFLSLQYSCLPMSKETKIILGTHEMVSFFHLKQYLRNYQAVMYSSHHI